MRIFITDFCKIAEDARLIGESVGKFAAQRIFGVLLLELDDRAVQHGFADDQLADEIHDVVDARGIHSQRIFGARRRDI